MRRQVQDLGGLSPHGRFWMEKNGLPVFGDGRARLLKAIGELGSIKAGAAKLGMSYRHAWGHLNHMERRLGVKLLKRQTGGARGGGSVLTPAARRLLAAYAAFRGRVDRELQGFWDAAASRRQD